jgi:hypothetical protein
MVLVALPGLPAFFAVMASTKCVISNPPLPFCFCFSLTRRALCLDHVQGHARAAAQPFTCASFAGWFSVACSF